MIRKLRCAVLAIALALPIAAVNGTVVSATPRATSSTVASWTPWHLTSPDQFRLPAPPPANSPQTRTELKELRQLQKQRTKKTNRIVKKWNDGAAVIPWTNVVLQEIRDFRPRPPVAGRVLAVFHTGLYDAMIAAADSRQAFASDTRPSPAAMDGRIDPLTGSKRGSTYAPVQAAMAGAAEKLLPYLFPAQDPVYFQELATQSVESRLWAGANYRSDVESARSLGQSVAQAVIDHVSKDGFPGSGFSNPRPEGDQYWQTTPPGYEQPTGGAVGKWRPWLMSTADQLRSTIPGPFAYGSPEFMTELHEVVDVQASLTDEQRSIAHFWDDGPGTYTPAGHWFSIAIELVKNFGLNSNETTKAFALLGATEADASIAFFEAKYHWWSVRPVTAVWRLCDGGDQLCTDEELEADPSRATYRNVWSPLIITPPFPSYPGGHSTFSGSAGKLLSYFFPAAGETLNQLAEEAAMSRLYGGIHYRSDNDAGLTLGRALADLAIARAEQD
ncbi:MAG: hypothetical protein QOG54_1655 [Actinomycetota bacterium]|nr:hypothetical protein [Actinomycetota bacterium]